MTSDRESATKRELVGTEAQKHFDEQAATWDENPMRQMRTAAIARGIELAIPLKPNWKAMEYGCGTAALSFALAPKLGEIVVADTSPGMMEQLHRKLKSNPGARIRPLVLDLTKEEGPAGQFDLVIIAMTLHHIPDLPQILSRLGHLLRDKGRLAIADLVTEDGSFHAPDTVPHNGFDPQKLCALVKQHMPARMCESHPIHNQNKNGRDYPIHLWVAQR